VVLPAVHVRAQEPSIAIPPVDVRPYSVSGLLELRPLGIWQDTGAAIFRLRAPAGEPPDARTGQLNSRLQVDAAYRRGWFSAQTRTVVDGGVAAGDWTADLTAYEAYVSLRPAPSLTIDAGKKTLKWGKGYLWNPVAFLDRPKSPEDPALALEGYTVLSADYIRTLGGPLQVVSFTPVLLPVGADLNRGFGARGHVNAAGKLYLLLADTDIDVMFLSGGSRPARFGFDVSRNLRSNLEVHAEWMRASDAPAAVVDADGSLAERRGAATSAVVGVRYLTNANTTLLVDYYRNGSGYRAEDMDRYFDLIERGSGLFAVSGDDRLLAAASRATDAGYGRMHSGRDYLYARVSQPDAFGVLYFTLGASAIVNLDDRSYTLLPEVQYKPFENLELRWLAGMQRGGRGSEFGEKPADLRLELRARYYF
jgi:hypothetical protein